MPTSLDPIIASQRERLAAVFRAFALGLLSVLLTTFHLAGLLELPFALLLGTAFAAIAVLREKGLLPRLPTALWTAIFLALFLAIGAIFYRVGTVRLSDLAGIGRKMPFTMTAFTIAGFGLVGTPGTSGFISKWYLTLGALDQGWWILVFLIVGSSLIALVYVGRVLEVAWLREPSAAIAHASDPPLSMLLPLIVLAAATIYFGIDTEWTAGIASTAAKALLGGLR